ncbi:MAG: MFS transporter [Deltaproteobacteria bacterium]|nr:MFS transporter [Deltaproteobacteria bacterium]
MTESPRWSAMGVACAGAFVTALSTSLVAVAAPTMARELHVSQADVGWVLSAYLLVISGLLAGAGRLADVVGRRRVYLTGFTIFAVGSFACGVAPTLPLLVGARVVQGLGSAAVMATAPAIITRSFPARLRARGLGLALAATYSGLTFGPTLGGILTKAVGWHAVFYVVGFGALVVIVIAWVLLPADEESGTSAGMDVLGTALFAIALGALLVALRRGPFALPLLGVSALAAILFVRHGARHPAPVLPLGLLKTPAFGLGVVNAMLLYVVAFVLSWLLPFHLQHARGIDPRHAGLLMTAQPATMALTAPLSGVIADRFGARAPAVAGMLAIAAGMILVGRAADGSDASIVTALVVVGLGAGLFVAPNNATIMAAAPRERQGTAAAMAATARNVGMTTGVALAVFLSELTTFGRSLAVAGAIALAGAALAAVK